MEKTILTLADVLKIETVKDTVHADSAFWRYG